MLVNVKNDKNIVQLHIVPSCSSVATGQLVRCVICPLSACPKTEWFVAIYLVIFPPLSKFGFVNFNYFNIT